MCFLWMKVAWKKINVCDIKKSHKQGKKRKKKE